jgi:hypothetical protein
MYGRGEHEQTLFHSSFNPLIVFFLLPSHKANNNNITYPTMHYWNWINVD